MKVVGGITAKSTALGLLHRARHRQPVKTAVDDAVPRKPPVKLFSDFSGLMLVPPE
jgi:hypothetical protein